ncbi:MAG: oxygen-independent coproporphyrinogen III oxidase [Planctomycetes bacterium]|nr:oxygen-independent coproporphyrinogen III oxidase [Planctomycetota bacterium]
MDAAALHVDEALLLRMSGAGPRYTSYPTVPEWGSFEDRDVRAALARASLRRDEPLSIYVHLPFCARLCLFCGCTVEITRRADRVARYLDALEREIDMTAPLLGERRRVAQVHWGGGTPTHLRPAQLRRVFEMLTKHFALEPGAEISLEVHPHVTTKEQIDTLVELGFNRISMGVQDLDAHVQKVIHRDQTTEETEELVAHCRARGIGGVNLDLMYGLPEQTEASFAATLATIARIRPDRLAVYGYAHVPWLKPQQRKLEEHHLPSPPERARLFFVALEELGRAGYEVIGLDHFALRSDALYRALEQGTLHRNFMGYTTHPAEEMLAFGMSAIGDFGGAFVQNLQETSEYEQAIQAGRFAVRRGLLRSAEDDLRRAAIQALMCRMRLDLDELECRTARPRLREHFATELEALKPLQAEGFCTIAGGHIEVTPRGRLFLRHLAMVFDEYLRKKRDADAGPRFSKTI